MPAVPRPNADLAQLRAFLFCREAIEKDSGYTLVGIQDTRISPTYPARFPELVAYISFETLRPEPVRAEIQVREPGGRVSIFAETVFDVDPSCVVLSVIPFDDFVFKAPGKYSFALHCNGTLVGTTSFTVKTD